VEHGCGFPGRGRLGQFTEKRMGESLMHWVVLFPDCHAGRGEV
jgi:hypothetical protein